MCACGAGYVCMYVWKREGSLWFWGQLRAKLWALGSLPAPCGEVCASKMRTRASAAALLHTHTHSQILTQCSFPVSLSHSLICLSVSGVPLCYFSLFCMIRTNNMKQIREAADEQSTKATGKHRREGHSRKHTWSTVEKCDVKKHVFSCANLIVKKGFLMIKLT